MPLHRRFLTNSQGGMATAAAIMVPVLIVMVGGAIDVAAIVSDNGHMRSVAEGAALAGASDLGLASDRQIATERAIAWAEEQLSDLPNELRATASAQIVELANSERGIRVDIRANRPSIFGRLLPPGGWHISVHAVAASANRIPLCILATRADRDKIIQVKDEASIRAPGCLIHSNQDIRVEGDAEVQAGLVRASRSLEGVIGSSGAQQIPDPFADLDLNPPHCGRIGDIEYTTGVHTLSPGAHCDNITVAGDATLRLLPGEHWFVRATLKAEDDARLVGDNVVLLFNRGAKFQFKERSRVSLSGRETGRFAGFVMAAVRGNDKDFEIDSEHVDNLLGVIYVPGARLIISGHSDIARESDWTVLVARQIQLTGNPRLYINANYRGSDVEVPQGVGPNASVSGATRLVE